jgi:hypothetical protein
MKDSVMLKPEIKQLHDGVVGQLGQRVRRVVEAPGLNVATESAFRAPEIRVLKTSPAKMWIRWIKGADSCLVRPITVRTNSNLESGRKLFSYKNFSFCRFWLTNLDFFQL